jgi:hypothetical protein
MLIVDALQAEVVDKTVEGIVGNGDLSVGFVAHRVEKLDAVLSEVAVFKGIDAF